jgi:hypothetical protein
MDANKGKYNKFKRRIIEYALSKGDRNIPFLFLNLLLIKLKNQKIKEKV